MGVFDVSAAALADVFAGACGETVSYSRDSSSVDLVAWRSPLVVALAVDSGDGALIQYESWEWHLAAADLEGLGLPEPGDRIAAADDRTYEVLEIPGMGCYVGDVLLRVHTKLVSPET